MMRRIPWHPTSKEMLFMERGRIKTCKICGKSDELISGSLGLCLSCIRYRPDDAIRISTDVHKNVREEFGLSGEPPKSDGGIYCNVCSNNCKMGEGETGYCGLRKNVEGKLESIEGVLSAYYDPLPTNCCASWFCSGSKNIGYNLAIFLYGCSFNCLFCQNWEHKLIDPKRRLKIRDLVELSKRAYCVCYFGGSPEPQLPFLLKASREMMDKKDIKVCWEWNGTGNRKLVREAAELSYESGGIVKFDLKAFDENIHIALTGRSNRTTLDNFRYIAENFEGEDLLTATTLLVPGYIDEIEVENLSRFISSLNSNIPYSLLVFHPDFKMTDLPITPSNLVYRCYRIAKRYLNRVSIGNLFLLRKSAKF